MSDELRWGPLYSRCVECKKIAELRVDKDFHPHLNGHIGVRCTLCGKGSLYVFGATPEAEIENQQKGRAEAEKHLAALPTFGPEEWPLFQAAMFGLMPQPAEPDDYTPDPHTLMRWRLLQAEAVGLRDRIEEAHDND